MRSLYADRDSKSSLNSVHRETVYWSTLNLSPLHVHIADRVRSGVSC